MATARAGNTSGHGRRHGQPVTQLGLPGVARRAPTAAAASSPPVARARRPAARRRRRHHVAGQPDDDRCAAAGQQHDAVGVLHDAFEPVLGQQHREAEVVHQPLEQREHFLGGGWVERRRRLVEHQHPRVRGEHRTDRDALLLSRREAHQRPVAHVGHARAGRALPRPGGASRRRRPPATPCRRPAPPRRRR